MTTAGYSGTPLARKLGVKQDFKILLFRAPDHFWTLFEVLPPGLEQVEEAAKESVDYMHFFITRKLDLEHAVDTLLPSLKKHGLLWISWPKKTSGLNSEVDKWMVLQTGRDAGLVDVKVAAIDEIWSGQKFVYRNRDR